jgi:hypothetical protein
MMQPATVIITDAQIVAVLGVRERFTHPFSEAIERACDALHRLADDLRLKRRGRRSEHAAAPPLPLLANQEAFVATAAESIGEAVRLKAAYQGALLLATTAAAAADHHNHHHGLSEAAASMLALSTYLLGAFPAAAAALAVVTDRLEGQERTAVAVSLDGAVAVTVSLALSGMHGCWAGAGLASPPAPPWLGFNTLAPTGTRSIRLGWAHSSRFKCRRGRFACRGGYSDAQGCTPIMHSNSRHTNNTRGGVDCHDVLRTVPLFHTT